MRIFRGRQVAILAVIPFFSVLTLAAGAQETTAPKKSGGIFDGLKKLIPEDTSALRKTLDSTWKSGTEGLKSFVDGISLPKEKTDELLSFLDQKLAGRQPAYTSEQVDAFSRGVIPAIEEVSQRKFSQPPQIKTVGTLQLVHALAQDLVPQFEARFPDVSKPLIYLRAYLSAGLISPNLLGKYSYTTKTVYVVPMNLEAILKQKGIGDEHRDQILQIVVGHELVHALQDQEVDLKRTVLAASSIDASNALNALIEGQAVYLQNALATKLKFQEAARKASELFLVEDLKEDAWVYERVSHVEGVLGEQTYLGGARFVAYHYGHGGMPAVWSILAQPPKRSSMITQPETYTTAVLPTPDYNAKFAPLRAHAGLDNDWTMDAAGVGDFQLRGAISETDRATRESLMRALSEAVSVSILHKKDLDRGIEVGLFKFKSEPEALGMVATLEKMAVQSFKDMERNPRVRVRDTTKQPYSIGPESSGTVWQYSVEAFLLGKSNFTKIAVRRKNSVVSLTDCGSGLSSQQLAKLVGECVEKMSQ